MKLGVLGLQEIVICSILSLGIALWGRTAELTITRAMQTGTEAKAS